MDMAHAVELVAASAMDGPRCWAARLLIAAFLVGLLVNIGQTLTQLHEPVVGMIPRLAAVALVLLLILPWILARWVSFAVDLIGSIPDLL